MSSTIRSRSQQILAAVLMACAAAACGGSDNDNSPTPPAANVPYSQTDLRVGTGAEATAGRNVTVHYTGWLYSPNAPENKGQQIDTSLQAGRGPYTFPLGTNAVIRGWDQGVVGMRVGGQRRLVIPPGLAYGVMGNGPVPPNATLVFDIELLGVS